MIRVFARFTKYKHNGREALQKPFEQTFDKNFLADVYLFLMKLFIQ